MTDSLIQDGQYNIGHICTRQQLAAGLADRVAMRWLAPGRPPSELTFSDLEAGSNRFANVLAGLGLSPGDVAFLFLPKCPEVFFAFLGGLKHRAIVGTLFANFGEEALVDRLGDSGARVVVTRKSLLRKLQKIRGQLPSLRFILVTDLDEDLSPDVLSWPRRMQAASPDFVAPPTGADTPSVLHYTSGSTGKPKGVLHRHGSVLHQHATTRDVLQVRPDDTFWCTADQGWVTGTSYGIIGPWSLGARQVHFGGNYDARAWLGILESEGVTVWYTAPTALRMLLREEDAVYGGFDLSRLRSIHSVGEPLNPEVIHWARRVLRREVHDTWFQTETGGIMIANAPGVPVRPGSMGRPVAGIEPAILSDDGRELPAGEQGNLCVRAGWSSMFTAYFGNPEGYAQKFRSGWYFTGDTAYRDPDGYYWFMGRSDDVINTAGHLVSPFEVESALLELDEVAESGVIGAPDPLLFEKVVAFVHLSAGCTWSRELELKIRLHVSNQVSTIAAPQEVVVTDAIPKNKAGKIMRRILKARYAGTDEGDTSTLET